MEVWKEFDHNDLTHSAAHHLLAIHEVGQKYGGWARVSDIAKNLGITRGSVSINLRALKKRELVETDEHRQVKLTAVGQQIVQSVLAKRAVMKSFLIEVLGMPETAAEVDSCKVEHLLSDAAGERLIHFMRYLNSEDPAARELLARFRAFHQNCPDPADCPICKEHSATAELQHIT